MTSWKNNNTLESRRLVEEVLDPPKKTRKPREIVAKDKNHLRRLILGRIKSQGPSCDLNSIDVSNIADMSGLFSYVDFNGDISQWDVSGAENMDMMFKDSKFSGNIAGWDISKARYTDEMFLGSPLEGKEPGWYKLNS